MVRRDRALKCDMAAREAEIGGPAASCVVNCLKARALNVFLLSLSRIIVPVSVSAAYDDHAGDREATMLSCASNWPIKRHRVSTASEPLHNTPYIPAGFSKETALRQRAGIAKLASLPQSPAIPKWTRAPAACQIRA